MAMKFLPGMTNVLEVLNQMWDAFAAGPYNALPLTGGTLTGPLTARDIGARTFQGSASVASGGTGLWFRLGRLSGQISLSGRMVVDGVAGYTSGGKTAGSTTLHFRRENDGKIRGSFYCNSSGSPGVVDAIVDDQDYVYVEIGQFHVGDVQVFGQFTFTPDYAVVGTVAPVGQRLLRKYSLMLGSTEVFSGDIVNGVGVLRTTLLKVNSSDMEPYHVVAATTGSEGSDILSMAFSAAFKVGTGNYGNTAQNASLLLTSNTATNRSLNAGGTINASGADYAEYLIKSLLCGTIAPGQIVGIDSDGRLTDKWDRAIAFMVKSTSPCMVGGDSWAQHLGQRPAAPVRVSPTVEQVLVTPAVPADEASGTEAIPAVYDSITTALGDTDDEWSAKQAAHEVAVIEFDIALEAARQTVDRIAFAGQVPVNVQGATPGQYIVPVQDGDGIGALAIGEDDITLKQYMRAVGKVIAIEDDGRARIIVRAA